MENKLSVPTEVPSLPKVYGNDLVKHTFLCKLVKAVILFAYIGLVLFQMFETYDHGIKTSNIVAGLIWGLIFWTPPFIVLWRFLDSKVEVTENGISIHRIRKNKFIPWQDIKSIDWRPGKFLWLQLTDGPVHACLILQDGNVLSINMVMHRTWTYFGGRSTAYVLPANPLNMSVMNELNALLETYNPQATSKTITPAEAQAIQNKDVTLMMSGQVTPEQVNEITTQARSSKIVRYGGAVLILFWVLVFSSVFARLVGGWGIALPLIFVIVIFIVHRWYKRTKSPLGWYFLRLLILILIAAMVAANYRRLK